jgi:hypothetical protein
MDRKRTLIHIVLLFSAAAGTPLVNLASSSVPFADFQFVVPWVWDAPPTISIHSPINETSVNQILLNFTVAKPERWYNVQNPKWDSSAIEQKLNSVSYEIDGNLSEPIAADTNLWAPFNFSVILTNLDDGAHTLKVQANSTGVFRDSHGFWHTTPMCSTSQTVHFTLDSKHLTVSILSLAENKTRGKINVELVLWVNEPASWIGYSLDDEPCVTIAGNTTITGLSDEAHNLQVYATDYAGNTGASETISFNVASFPTALVIASAVSTALVAAGLLFYFRKRKHKQST